MAGRKTVIAFDLYGTLLSTESIAEELAKLFGEEKAKSVAALWRRYQLEYTWRSNSMGEYKSFSDITRSSLGHALVEHGLVASQDKTDRLMRAYDALHVFPDVSAALNLLREKSDLIDAYVFSNGTAEMVGNSINSSPDLGPCASVFRSLITVDTLRVFKPDKRVYEHLVQVVGKQENKSDVWVVSANPFDIVGSKVAGLRAAFIDRAGKGWVDRLDEVNVPSIIAGGVDKAISAILSWEEEVSQKTDSKI
ncbi:HAD-like domain-containing protein [Xylariales sp. PMI_506]|nr:HAD-like domain-containing protein [Xylariales sp. PMI_506]